MVRNQRIFLDIVLKIKKKDCHIPSGEIVYVVDILCDDEIFSQSFADFTDFSTTECINSNLHHFNLRASRAVSVSKRCWTLGNFGECALRSFEASCGGTLFCRKDEGNVQREGESLYILRTGVPSNVMRKHQAYHVWEFVFFLFSEKLIANS